MIWLARSKSWDVSRKGHLMGILNTTPDSFSDGGSHLLVPEAVEYALCMEEQGAAIIDVGGESTRPGSKGVSVEEELERVIPVIRGIRERSDVLLSVDTRKTEVAREALRHGADIINDIEGLASPGMAELCAETGCGVVIMHMQGRPETMQDAPRYDDVVGEVREFFRQRFDDVIRRGVRPEQICWDPGVGFGKSLEHNLSLIARLEELRVAGRPILLALSRKGALGRILGDTERGRDALSTAVMTVYGHRRGAQIHRVHDVRECAQALKLIQTVEEYE